jgi:hypothetical protein
MTSKKSGNPQPLGGKGDRLPAHVGGGGLREFGIDPNRQPDASQWARLCRLVRALVNNPSTIVGHDSSETIFPPNTTARGRSSSGSAAFSSLCYFGETYVEDADTFLRGGLVHAGDKHYNVPGTELDLGTPGDWLMQLKFDVEVWRDDANEILLPGIKTSAETDASTFWDYKVWTISTDYDDDTQPTVATGIGSIVIPLGRLTITGGVATFVATDCGHVTVGHCAGTLSHTRG